MKMTPMACFWASGIIAYFLLRRLGRRCLRRGRKVGERWVTGLEMALNGLARRGRRPWTVKKRMAHSGAFGREGKTVLRSRRAQVRRRRRRVRTVLIIWQRGKRVFMNKHRTAPPGDLVEMPRRSYWGGDVTGLLVVFVWTPIQKRRAMKRKGKRCFPSALA